MLAYLYKTVEILWFILTYILPYSYETVKDSKFLIIPTNVVNGF